LQRRFLRTNGMIARSRLFIGSRKRVGRLAHLLRPAAMGCPPVAVKSLFEKSPWEHGAGKLREPAGRDARATMWRRHPGLRVLAASLPPVSSFQTGSKLGSLPAGSRVQGAKSVSANSPMNRSAEHRLGPLRQA